MRELLAAGPDLKSCAGPAASVPAATE